MAAVSLIVPRQQQCSVHATALTMQEPATPFCPAAENENAGKRGDNTRPRLRPLVPFVSRRRKKNQIIKSARSHAVKTYSPKFPFNKVSENENIIFSQADGDCCFLTAGGLISPDMVPPA